MESKFSVLITLFLINQLLLTHIASNKCCDYCNCTLYNRRNRADCSQQKLMTAYVEISGDVEILLLNHNEIMYLQNDCFEKFINLIELDLSFNTIQTIELDTFSPLYAVERIDLSYNHIESFDNRIFEFNIHLHTLNLEGNRFMALPNEPLIQSNHLRNLNLRNAQLNFLHEQLFTALPQLQELDISHNLLIILSPKVFLTNKQLLQLHLNGNPWHCEQMQKDVNQLRNLGIDVAFSDCDKFERLTLPTNIDELREWREIFNENLQAQLSMDYMTDRNVCENVMPKLCLRYEECLEEVWLELKQRTLDFQTAKENGLKIDIKLKLAVLFGIALGVTASIIILTTALCFKACLEYKKNKPLVSNSSQPRQRRRLRAYRSVIPQQHMVTPSADNFIARLLGRPAREQYYRAINQNTATLIRRLSRSNLFNNRLNQISVEQNTIEPAYNYQVRPETPPPKYATIKAENEELQP